LLSVGHPSAPGVDTQSRFHAYNAENGALLWTVNLPGHAHAPVGGAYSDTPTLSVSADVDNDGCVESIFAIGGTLYVVGANPGGTSGQIEWTYTPDGGLLGSPILADANGDGRAEIIVVSTSGMIYGIGNPAASTTALASAFVDVLSAPSSEDVDAGARVQTQASTFFPLVNDPLNRTTNRKVQRVAEGSQSLEQNSGNLLLVAMPVAAVFDEAFDMLDVANETGKKTFDFSPFAERINEQVDDMAFESLFNRNV
jgi:hypothetical protein